MLADHLRGAAAFFVLRDFLTAPLYFVFDFFVAVFLEPVATVALPVRLPPAFLAAALAFSLCPLCLFVL
jgi:hypothetical protein